MIRPFAKPVTDYEVSMFIPQKLLEILGKCEIENSYLAWNDVSVKIILWEKIKYLFYFFGILSPTLMWCKLDE